MSPPTTSGLITNIWPNGIVPFMPAVQFQYVMSSLFNRECDLNAINASQPTSPVWWLHVWQRHSPLGQIELIQFDRTSERIVHVLQLLKRSGIQHTATLQCNLRPFTQQNYLLSTRFDKDADATHLYYVQKIQAKSYYSCRGRGG